MEKRMIRYLRLSAGVLLLLLVLPTLSGPPKPLVFEISFPKELSASPVDGHVLLLISKDGKQDPRLAASGLGEGIESQQKGCSQNHCHS
jgi:hypothetical protein